MAITHFLSQSNIISNYPSYQQTLTLHLRRPLCSFPTKRNYSPCCIKASPKYNIKCFINNHRPPQRENVFYENNILKQLEINVVKALRIPVIITVVLFGCLLSQQQGRHALAAAPGGPSSSNSSTSHDHVCTCSTTPDYTPEEIRLAYKLSYLYDTPVTPRTIGYNALKDKYEAERLIYPFLLVFPFCFLCCVIYYYLVKAIAHARTRLQKLRVAINLLYLKLASLGKGRSLQRDLKWIVQSADTSTSKGLNYILQETILALLRHSDHCISGYSFEDVKRSVHEFDAETLLNVNNIKKISAPSQSSTGLYNKLASWGKGRSLQRDLKQIVESADTSTSKGLNHILQETILALLRHSGHCIPGYSFEDVKKSVHECEKLFDQLSVKESGKFDE